MKARTFVLENSLYSILLLLHSYTRWLVLVGMVWALFRAWTGLVQKRSWNKWDNRAGLFFATIFSLQFVFGLLLYLQPVGIAQAALQNMAASMKVRELRFFGLEHPLQMITALFVVHLGRARSRKAVSLPVKYRWAVICYTIGAVAILIAIPWWRPLLRAIQQ